MNNGKLFDKLRKADPATRAVVEGLLDGKIGGDGALPVSADRVKVPTYSSFADALKRSGMEPQKILSAFVRGKIRVEPFSRHPMGPLGSLKVGRVVESRLYDGAESVTLTAADIRSIYAASGSALA